MNINFEKMNGLIPAIVQDIETKSVLMLGFMNKEAYEKTIKDGKVTFWSRSKKRLWQKGETSGNYLEVVSIKPDCDNDTLLILVKPKGPTCHKGEYSCFGEMQVSICFLYVLFGLIKSRKKEMPEGSYTSDLFRSGLTKILEKIKEESDEVIFAAEKEDKQRLIEESGDLIYHLLVLLVQKGLSVEDIINELIQRNK